MNVMSGMLVPANASLDRVETDRATFRMGEMLASAIRHGALLDKRWWPAWMEGAQKAVSIVGELVAVEMYSPDLEQEGLHPHRRWFADPVTRLLIVEWWRDELRLPEGATPEHCLAKHWKRTSDQTHHRIPGVIDQWRTSWSFQLPGLLLAFATGPARTTFQHDRAPAASAPQATWERVIHGRDIPDLPEAIRAALPDGLFDDRPLRPGEGDLFAVLKGASSRYERGKDHAVGSKVRGRSGLEAICCCPLNG